MSALGQSATTQLPAVLPICVAVLGSVCWEQIHCRPEAVFFALPLHAWPTSELYKVSRQGLAQEGKRASQAA